MKKIICKKEYDTETSTLIKQYTFGQFGDPAGYEKDLYQTAARGCTAYILPKKLFSFPTLLVDYLNQKGIDSLIWATSAFRLTAESGIFDRKNLPGIRHVILGGEAMQAKHLTLWKKAAPECEFINLYGPTEVTVDCTAYKIDRDFEDGEPIPIGKPAATWRFSFWTRN